MSLCPVEAQIDVGVGTTRSKVAVVCVMPTILAYLLIAMMLGVVDGLRSLWISCTLFIASQPSPAFAKTATVPRGYY